MAVIKHFLKIAKLKRKAVISETGKQAFGNAISQMGAWAPPLIMVRVTFRSTDTTMA
ncbi:MAG: hypothetical protein IPK68_04650 [Bdellovibrionales bacterium]|nr:hypothetical protein [Bdellovibrionales bacterium]